MPAARFFEDYKKNENKEVKVDEFLGAEVARKTVLESMVSACHANSAMINPILPPGFKLGTATITTTYMLAKHGNIQWPLPKCFMFNYLCVHACASLSLILML